MIIKSKRHSFSALDARAHFGTALFNNLRIRNYLYLHRIVGKTQNMGNKYYFIKPVGPIHLKKN